MIPSLAPPGAGLARRCAAFVLLVAATGAIWSFPVTAASQDVKSRGAEPDPFLEAIDRVQESRVRSVLERFDAGSTPRPAVGRELRSLGDEALDAIFAALAIRSEREQEETRTRGDDTVATPDGLLLETFAGVDGKTLTGLLGRVARRAHHISLRVAAVLLLGERRDTWNISLLWQCAAAPTRDPDDLENLGRAFENALTRILAREPRSFEKLERSWQSADPELLAPAIRALGASGDPRALPVLLSMLKGSSDAEELLIAQIGRIAPRLSREASAEAAERVRGRLDPNRPGTSRSAAITLGRLLDTRSVPDLIRVLENGAPEVRDGALWSLRRISGLDLRRDPGPWTAWYENERTWFHDESQTVLGDLRSDDIGSVAAAVQGVARHPLFRGEFTPELALLLRHRDAAIRRLACEVLGQIGTSAAETALIQVLRDGDKAIQGKALIALRTITGLDLPAEANAWQEALRKP